MLRATLALLIAPSLVLAGELTIDAKGSKVEFVGHKTDGKHAGGFKAFTGTVTTADSAAATVEKVSLEIKTASLFADDAKLTNHLKSGDFFNVNKFPKATFASTKVEPVTDVEGATHKITGELTLVGKTQEISFPAKVAIDGAKVKFEGTFTIDKDAFGMTYGAGKIKNEVPVTFSIVAEK